MKFNIYTLVIVATIICYSNSVQATSRFEECLEEYVDLKMKFKNEDIIVEASSGCSSYIKILETLVKGDDDNKMPIKLSAKEDCAVKELKNLKHLNILLGVLPVFSKSESPIKNGNDVIRNLFKVVMLSVSLKCTDIEDIGKSFDAAGIKNLIISTPEEKYCFAKYADEEDLFETIENYEYNPSGISITNINCTAIIKEKREQFLSGSDNPDFLFEMRVYLTVLDYIDFPIKEKDAEKTMFKTLFAKAILEALDGISVDDDDDD